MIVQQHNQDVDLDTIKAQNISVMARIPPVALLQPYCAPPSPPSPPSPTPSLTKGHFLKKNSVTMACSCLQLCRGFPFIVRGAKQHILVESPRGPEGSDPCCPPPPPTHLPYRIFLSSTSTPCSCPLQRGHSVCLMLFSWPLFVIRAHCIHHYAIAASSSLGLRAPCDSPRGHTRTLVITGLHCSALYTQL